MTSALPTPDHGDPHAMDPHVVHADADGPDAHRGAGVPDAAAAARLRARYPRSWLRGPFGILLALVLLGAVLVWTVWAGVHGATRPAQGQVHSFRASNDNLVHVTIDVQRRDTARGASCEVIAAGTNGVAVGEATASVPAGGTTMASTSVDIRTTGRALSARIGSCTAG